VLRRITEKQILPFIEKRIRQLENNIASTRKGFKNTFKSIWKKAERGENDGLKENFKVKLSLLNQFLDEQRGIRA
jgi:ER-Golgi trafficking TRAPP I complex 85 kDa subunit